MKKYHTSDIQQSKIENIVDTEYNINFAVMTIYLEKKLLPLRLILFYVTDIIWENEIAAEIMILPTFYTKETSVDILIEIIDVKCCFYIFPLDESFCEKINNSFKGK